MTEVKRAVALLRHCTEMFPWGTPMHRCSTGCRLEANVQMKEGGTSGVAANYQVAHGEEHWVPALAACSVCYHFLFLKCTGRCGISAFCICRPPADGCTRCCQSGVRAGMAAGIAEAGSEVARVTCANLTDKECAALFCCDAQQASCFASVFEKATEDIIRTRCVVIEVPCSSTSLHVEFLSQGLLLLYQSDKSSAKTVHRTTGLPTRSWRLLQPAQHLLSVRAPSGEPKLCVQLRSVSSTTLWHGGVSVPR